MSVSSSVSRCGNGNLDLQNASCPKNSNNLKNADDFPRKKNSLRARLHLASASPPLSCPPSTTSAQIYRASNAHACVLVFKAFKAVVDTAGSAGDPAPGGQNQPQQALDGPTCYALELLLLLLGLYWVQNDMGDFVEDGK